MNRLIKQTIPLLILAVSLCFSNCAKKQPYGYYKVTKIIDGDTIELENGKRIRYIGIDTPETRKRQGDTWIYSPDVYSEEAKEFNRKLVENKVVRLEFDVTKKDKYDRWLAYCFVGDEFVNAKMLKEGFALLYTMPPNVKYVDMFVKLQQEARQNNRGLWGVSPLISAKDARRYVDKVVTVEGKASSIYQSGKVTILNFGSSGFKTVIFKEEYGLFMVSGVAPLKAYKGKLLRVTGKVKIYKDKPEIIVRHPSDIEVVD